MATSSRDARRDPVSIIIPTFNEERHIDACLQSVYDQTYGVENLEVLIADGRSDDRTRELAAAWTDRLTGLRVVDNPKRHQGAGLNIAIDAASHEVIVRLDAHTRYATDYVERCVDALQRTDAAMVGGPMRPEGTTSFGKAVAVATTTPFGVGPGRFHYSEREEWVDTVYLGAFRRGDILNLGGYDEAALASEDHELNFRLTKEGGKILLDPTIRSTYVPRSTPVDLWRQYHKYGIGKVATLRKHRALPTWRPFVPTLFVLGLLLGPLWWQFTPTRLAFIATMALYGVLVAITAVAKSRLRPLLTLRTIGAILVMHVSYGLGFLRGLTRAILRRPAY